MTITEQNKEEVFAGILRKSYNFQQMQEIKAQFERNPSLYADFQFYKRMVYSAQLLEVEEMRERVALKQRMEKYTHAKKAPETPFFWIVWLRKPAYRWVASLIVLFSVIVGYQTFFKNKTQKAEYISINYHEINHSGVVVNGENNSTTDTDTLKSQITVIYFPSKSTQSYRFRNDTLVLYGKFEIAKLRYQFDTKTQQRILFINDQAKRLDYSYQEKLLE